jgi:glycerol kinase
VIAGLTRFANRGHLARAALEATAFQTRDMLVAMQQDAGLPLRELRVDGGMVANGTLMQFQADILGIDVVRPAVTETTALGAAYAAGLAVQYWRGRADLVANWRVEKRWRPQMAGVRRDALVASWQKAISRSLDWTT